MPDSALKAFFELLHATTGAQVFNPWTQCDDGTDAPGNGPAARLQRLRAHLAVTPRQILIGEASGYQGCHVSGIPFTSERLIMAGHIPRIDSDGTRLSTRQRPWSEPSATTVWGTLHQLGIADDTVLWNAYPWHPHLPGKPQSNRTPTPSERAAGLATLNELLAAFPGARLFAVGRHAEAATAGLGRKVTPLRHPSMGGATAFREGLQRALRGQVPL